MKRIAVVLLIIICLTTLTMGCQPKNVSLTLTDDAGKSISFDTPPQRIVSHVPSITEMLYALNLQDSIVGVDDYSNYPPEAKQKPSVGNYWEPSIEQIVSLNPDLVLTDGHSENTKQLDGFGIKTVTIDPKNIEGILKDLELIGKIAGKEAEAKKLIADMNAQITSVESKVKSASKVSVFYVLDAKTDPNNPWTAGPDSFIDSLITMAGGINVAGTAASSYAQFSIEQLVASDPEILVLAVNTGSDVTAADLKNSPIWSKLTAVKTGNIFTFNADLANPVPRITQGLQDMAKIIHPELFK
jgi:iron complex transport system substrate-binding protein